MKIFSAIALSLLMALAAFGQTSATARIQALAYPASGTTLEVGPSGNTKVFEFAPADPQNGNIWIDNTQNSICPFTYCVMYGFTEFMASVLLHALPKVGISVVYGGADVIYLTVDAPGSAGNDFVLETDTPALCVAGFCGGSD